jgi:murein DD-endopeptidase MepM/ murein hydrolase activator NlpD
MPRLIAVTGLVLAAGLVTGAAPAAAAQYWNGASAAHPYSNPLWWPLNASGTAVGCYHGNGPDCRNPLQHKVYAMDVAAPNNSSLPVYAMGAGVVHIGNTAWRCGQSQSRGNWLTVDHGNGITSEYGHLGRIYVHNGDFVTARTKLATVGQSGYQKCAKKPWVRYLWVAVRHNGSYWHFRSTLTCIRGVVTSWPRRLSTHPTDDWNKVPAHTALPRSDRSCTPDTPATPRKPSSKLARAGAGNLRATWARARSGDRVTVVSVQLQEYHPSIHRWLDDANRRLSGGYTATTFGKLQKGRHFRARVWMANSTGWSAPSYWHAATPS